MNKGGQSSFLPSQSQVILFCDVKEKKWLCVCTCIIMYAQEYEIVYNLKVISYTRVPYIS